MKKLQTQLATAILIVVLTSCLIDNSAIAQTNYLTYHNARFGFSIQYPSTFRLSEPPANGDGISFLPLDRSGDFRAFSSFNALDRSGPQLFQEAANEITQSGGVVTYAVRLPNGFVVSGVIGNRVRYERVLFADDRGHLLNSSNVLPTDTHLDTFWAEYPVSRKEEFDGVVSVMSRSLNAGRGIY